VHYRWLEVDTSFETMSLGTSERRLVRQFRSGFGFGFAVGRYGWRRLGGGDPPGHFAFGWGS
jgi:hypothetical protein